MEEGDVFVDTSIDNSEADEGRVVLEAMRQYRNRKLPRIKSLPTKDDDETLSERSLRDSQRLAYKLQDYIVNVS